jgi:hypothetical protein
MVRLLADENLESAIIQGLVLREPTLDLIEAREAGLAGWPDERLLEWAAAEGRVLLTHDRWTMTGFVLERVRAGLPMPGVIVVRDKWAPGPLIEDILIVLFAQSGDELRDTLTYVPL